MTAVCIIPNCNRSVPAHEPFCSEHRDKPQRTREPIFFDLQTPPKPLTDPDPLTASMRAAHRGDLEEAERLFKVWLMQQEQAA